jgi:hypothetical protein
MQAMFLRTPEEIESERRSARSFRWRLRDMSGRIMAGANEGKGERVGKCGHRLHGPQAIICVGQAGAYVGGVETCGSVWMCPVCAAKIAEGRRKDLAAVLDAHMAGVAFIGPMQPGKSPSDVFMALFTIPHRYEESCAALKGFVAGAWRRMIQGKAWKSARVRWDVVGYIRALELTHGANGWHPHIHALFMTRVLTPNEFAEMRVFLGERWAAIVLKMTGKAVNLAKGFGFERACSIQAAGDYVAKWGVDSEIAKAHVKVSRKGGRSPWQLLADASEGDHRARMVFREYASAMKGARHLTWARGLRELYLIEPEKTDEELARMDAPFNGDAQIIEFRRGIWFEIRKAGHLPEILSAAEDAGKPGILKFLRGVGLALPEAEHDDRPKPPTWDSEQDQVSPLP